MDSVAKLRSLCQKLRSVQAEWSANPMTEVSVAVVFAIEAVINLVAEAIDWPDDIEVKRLVLECDTLKDQWRARETEKHYVTIVEGRVEPIAGIVDAELGPDPNDGRRRAVVEEGENAYSEYRVREQYGNDHALLDVEIRTGRTHQIRVHLEAIGYPVMGDSLYGKRSEYIGRQALHAAKLGFRLPSTGEYRAFEAPIPPDMQRVIDTLRTQYTDDSKGPQQ